VLPEASEAESHPTPIDDIDELDPVVDRVRRMDPRFARRAEAALSSRRWKMSLWMPERDATAREEHDLMGIGSLRFGRWESSLPAADPVSLLSFWS